jgi:hypothetical protein
MPYFRAFLTCAAQEMHTENEVELSAVIPDFGPENENGLEDDFTGYWILGRN